MRHVTIADKSLLVGDEAADLLVEYAKVLAQESTADSVDIQAVGSDGSEVRATFLLNGGITIMSESTTSHLPEPDNTKAEQYMHTQIVHLKQARTTAPEDISGERIWNTGPVD